MAFRSQACTLILLAVSAAAAAEFPVTHMHLRRDRPGVLFIDESGIRYTETEKHKDPHEYRWAWTDIQKLTLTPDRIEIVTYKDVKWLLNKDREFTFLGSKLDAAYDLLRGQLPRRLVAEVAVATAADDKLLARRLEGRTSYTGTLLFAQDRLVFASDTPRGSHTWIWTEVENISSVDPMELTVSSLGTDYRIQLREPLPQELYDSLWRKLNIQRSHR